MLQSLLHASDVTIVILASEVSYLCYCDQGSAVKQHLDIMY